MVAGEQKFICSWSEPTSHCMQGKLFKQVAGRHFKELGHQQDVSMAAPSSRCCGASSKLIPTFPHTTCHHHLVLQVLLDGPCTAVSFPLQWTFKNLEVDGVVRCSSLSSFFWQGICIPDRVHTPMLPCLELVWRTVWKRYTCRVKIVTAKVGTVTGKEPWWGLLVLGKASGQYVIVEQSHHLQTACKEKGLNY